MVAALIVAGSVIPALVAAWSGLELVPRNDDWSYRGISLDLYLNGEMRLDGASQTFAFGQVLLTMPFLLLSQGGHQAFFTFGVLVSGAAAASGYALARFFTDRSEAALVVVSLVAAPGYLAYSSSYMTDVPALAAQLLALCCGVVAVRGPRLRLGWLVAAVLIGCLAFSIRQFAIAAPIAVAGAALMTHPRRRSAWAVAVGTMLMLAGVALLQAAVPGQVGATPLLPGGVDRATSIIPTLGLLLMPVSLRAALTRKSDHGLRSIGSGLAAVAFVVLTYALGNRYSITLDNLMSPWGVPSAGYIVGGRPELFGPLAWSLIQAVALAAILPLVTATVASGRSVARALRRDPPMLHGPVIVLSLFALLSLGGLVLYASFWAFFDRYLWPVLVVLAILLLFRTSRDRVPSEAGINVRRTGRFGAPWIAPTIAVAILLGVGTGYALNSFAFDASRWRAGESLIGLGYSPDVVDAGYEWLGTYAPAPVRVHDRQVRRMDSLSWYGNIWPNFRRCVVVSGQTLDPAAFQLLDAEPRGYRLFLIVGPDVPLYLYRALGESCGPRSSQEPTEPA